MSENNWSDKQLEELLRVDRESEPPAFLREMILHRIDTHRPSFGQRLWGWLHRPYALHLKPLQLAATAAALALCFWAGMVTERNVGSETPLASAMTENPRANYLIGRGLLAGDRGEAALPYLVKAVEQDPTSAEFSHWQGVAYWTLGQSDLERQSYVRTVRYNPDHLPTHLNLGHNSFEQGKYKEALASYQWVLDHDPNVPEALYNKALVYHKLGDVSREKQAFRDYLQKYRTGKWAWRAVEHLHTLGDYRYRIYRIGVHRLVLNMSALLVTESASQRGEIERLAAVLEKSRADELHIVAYDERSRAQAREVALAIRRQLSEYGEAGELIPVRTSWFATAETLSDPNQTQLSQSILVFTRQQSVDNRRNAT